MLLSFFSRRTLEADSRDSYGFAVRPQHIQAYKEYGKIYKEEEEQRSAKWSSFLEQCSESQPSKPSEAKSEALLEADSTGKMAVTLENPEEGDDTTSKKFILDKCKESGSRKMVPVVQGKKLRKIITWEPIRSSLSPIGKIMGTRGMKKPYNQQADAERNNFHKTDQEHSTDKNVTSKDNCNAAEAVEYSSESEHISHDSPNKIDLSISWKEELESLVQVGVPKALRGEIWQAFVGVQPRRVEKYYQKLISPGADMSDFKWRKQIEKDLPRTFPGHPALDEEGRSSLRRILTAYALHNPSVGYCQAMNFFAGLLLLLMPEENAFWALAGLIDDYFDGYFTQEMIESQVDQLVFDELMRERFPKLVKHLDFLGVEVAWVSGSWFLSIFVNMLPWESVLRVWDVLLFEGNRVMLFRTALAIMELYGPALVTTKDAGDAVTLLQNLTGSTFDSSQLVFTACIGFLDVAESKLEKLRSKHRPSVLGIIEERKKEKQLSKVESKLYSFKHRKSLIKDQPKRKESLGGKRNHGSRSIPKSAPDNFDEFMCALSIDTECDSVPDLQEQVIRLKAELSQMMDEKRLAILRAEELEMALLESKRDDRQKLMGRIEQLEQEVTLLRQHLTDKQEQERSTLQVLMRVEQEKKEAENARIAAVQEVAAQKHEAYLHQQKYENAMVSLAEMEKSLSSAVEPMLEDALQKESGGAQEVSSPRFDNSPHE